MMDRRQGGFNQGVAPINVGDEIDVRIEAVGAKGDGIARKKGFVIFVPGVKEGDEVRIRVTKVLRKVGFGEVIGESQGKIEDRPAPQRRERAQMAPAPEPEPAPEDSEDFGEDDVVPEVPEDEPAEDFEDDLEPAPEPEDDLEPAPEPEDDFDSAPEDDSEDK